MQHKQKEHRIRVLWNEHERLHEAWRSLPLIPYDKPVRNGYKKYFVLRDDVKRRNDAEVFERILTIINTTVYSADTDFKVTRKVRRKGWRGKIHKKKEIVEIPHFLRVIPKQQWEKLNWPSHFTKYFYYGVAQQQDRYGNVRRYEGYIFVNPYFFDTEIKEHFVTHYQKRDPDLESQIAKLDNKLWGEHLWPKISNMLRGSDKTGWDKVETSKQRAIRQSVIPFEKQYAEEYIMETAEDAMLRKYLMDRYGFETIPWDDPYYVFEKAGG